MCVCVSLCLHALSCTHGANTHAFCPPPHRRRLPSRIKDQLWTELLTQMNHAFVDGFVLRSHNGNRETSRERERERERETIIITHTCKHADAHNLSPPLVLSFQVCWSEAVHKRRPSVDAAGLQTISQSHPKVYSNQVCIASPLSLFPQMGFHSPFLPLDTHMHSHTLTHSLTHAHAHPLSHTHTHTLSCAPSACSCRPNMDLVQNYITAFYLSEADFEAWLHKHHQRHTPKQLTQLVNHTFAQNKKTRQRLVKLVTELMQAPVTQPQ